jgi:hypothetical protein
MRDQTIRPHGRWYLIPVIVALAAIFLVPVWIVAMATHRPTYAVQFTVPGQKDLQIPRPGRYVLWDETDTWFQGQHFTSNSNMPAGLRIQLLAAGTTNTIPMAPAITSTMTVNQTVRHSVGTFRIEKPGKYQMAVTGQFPVRVFYFRDSVMTQFWSVMVAFEYCALGLCASLGLTLIIFFQRLASRKRGRNS